VVLHEAAQRAHPEAYADVFQDAVWACAAWRRSNVRPCVCGCGGVVAWSSSRLIDAQEFATISTNRSVAPAQATRAATGPPTAEPPLPSASIWLPKYG
jgi:hypothetical protein